MSLDSVATEINDLNDQTNQLCGSLNQFVIDADTDFSDLDTVVDGGDATVLAVEGSSGGSTATADGGTALSEDDESRDTGRPADATGFEFGST